MKRFSLERRDGCGDASNAGRGIVVGSASVGAGDVPAAVIRAVAAASPSAFRVGAAGLACANGFPARSGRPNARARAE